MHLLIFLEDKDKIWAIDQIDAFISAQILVDWSLMVLVQSFHIVEKNRTRLDFQTLHLKDDFNSLYIVHTYSQPIRNALPS